MAFQVELLWSVVLSLPSVSSPLLEAIPNYMEDHVLVMSSAFYHSDQRAYTELCSQT